MRPHSTYPRVSPEQFRLWATLNCIWAILVGLVTSLWWLVPLGLLGAVITWWPHLRPRLDRLAAKTLRWRRARRQ